MQISKALNKTMPNIFVGNLPFDAEESQLRQTFERYGRVTSVRMATDRATNRPRGFEFVYMPSLDDADEAITRLAGTSMGGRRLTINEAQTDVRPLTESQRDAKEKTNALLKLFSSL